MITVNSETMIECQMCHKTIHQIPMIITIHRIGVRVFCDSCWNHKKIQSQNILCAYTHEELKALLDAIKELADLFAPMANEIAEAINLMIKIMSDFIEKLAEVKK